MPRDFWKFLTGQTISTLGSAFSAFALPLLVFQLTHSPLSLAITTITFALPHLLFGLFIGAAMSVRKNNHIQVDYFYRLMPKAMGRVLSTAVDVVRCLFLGYASWLTWLLLQRIGNQPMAVIDLPVGWVFSAMLFGFTLMFLRSLQVAWRHWTLGYSVLERPEFPEA